MFIPKNWLLRFVIQENNVPSASSVFLSCPELKRRANPYRVSSVRLGLCRRAGWLFDGIACLQGIYLGQPSANRGSRASSSPWTVYIYIYIYIYIFDFRELSSLIGWATKICYLRASTAFLTCLHRPIS